MDDKTVNIYSTRLTEDQLVSLVIESTYICERSDLCILDAADKAAALLESVFDASNLTEEHFWLIALNSAKRVIGLFEISHGMINTSYAGPREIYLRALLCGAASIIIAHNHPSGSLEVSENDRNTTIRITYSGILMGIKLDDHIVVAGAEFTSAYY